MSVGPGSAGELPVQKFGLRITIEPSARPRLCDLAACVRIVGKLSDDCFFLRRRRSGGFWR